MALVLITHDMGVVAETAERVAVFYAGQKVEEQNVRRALRRSAPSLHGGAACAAAGARGGRMLPSIAGVVPGQFDRPTGCLFSPRCRFATERCVEKVPPRQGEKAGFALCHYPLSRRAAGRPSRSAGGGGRVSRRPPTSFCEAENLSALLCARRAGRSRRPLIAEGRRRRQLHARSRQDAGGGRRIRLRQVDACPHGHDDRAADRRASWSSTASTSSRVDRRRCSGSGARSRSSSRTPTARSIRARRSARSWRSRSRSTGAE